MNILEKRNWAVGGVEDAVQGQGDLGGGFLTGKRGGRKRRKGRNGTKPYERSEVGKKKKKQVKDARAWMGCFSSRNCVRRCVIGGYV
jgi:hypothetical protein